MSDELSVSVVTLIWYNGREDFDRMVEVLGSNGNLPRSYEAWLRAAEKGEQKIRNSGMRIVRVVVNPNAFAAWCVTRVCDVNHKSLQNYATFISRDTVLGRNN